MAVPKSSHLRRRESSFPKRQHRKSYGPASKIPTSPMMGLSIRPTLALSQAALQYQTPPPNHNSSSSLATPIPSPAPSRPASPRSKINNNVPVRQTPQPLQQGQALLVDFLYREVFGIMDIKESEGPHNQQRVVDFFRSFVEMERLVSTKLVCVLCVLITVFLSLLRL